MPLVQPRSPPLTHLPVADGIRGSHSRDPAIDVSHLGSASLINRGQNRIECVLSQKAAADISIADEYPIQWASRPCVRTYIRGQYRLPRRIWLSICGDATTLQPSSACSSAARVCMMRPTDIPPFGTCIISSFHYRLCHSPIPQRLAAPFHIFSPC